MKYLFRHICISLIIYSELSNGKPSKPRQFNNISFAFPALNILGGGGGTATGGNIFRQATVTRTVIRTVSTITQAAVRTCTAPLPAPAAFPPCPGRRRRSVNAGDELVATEPSIMVIIGTTSITDQVAVSELLNLTPNQDFPKYERITTINPITEEDLMTKLYPSQDNPESLTSELFTSSFDEPNGLSISTNELPVTSQTGNDGDNGDNDLSRAGLNFAGTTTITSTIPVTAVTSTFVSGVGVGSTSVTLTVTYGGCSPSSFPISGTPCP